VKLLACSDIHGNREVYRWLAGLGAGGDIDAIVLAGDLLGAPDDEATLEEAQLADARACFSLLEPAGKPVYYLMGNDDFVDVDPPSPSFVPLHGRRVDLGTWNLVGYHHSPPFIGGPHEKPEEEIRQDLERLAPLVDERTVLVTHSPAAGILDVGIFDVHAGSPAILDLVRERNPRAHIHGHIHSCFGREGRHFNVAAAYARRAQTIDLDTLEADEIRG